MKIKGITSGTYLEKICKNEKHKQIKKQELCNKCKYQDVCKYKKISKFENKKVFQNNVECEVFYFKIVSKAILTTGRDTTTGKRTTKTFVGENEEIAFNKALAMKVELEKNYDKW